MLTGDKQGMLLFKQLVVYNFINCLFFAPSETANNIGYSCQLLTDDMVEFFIVECQNIEDVALQLTKCNESLQGYTRSHIPTAISVNTGLDSNE